MEFVIPGRRAVASPESSKPPPVIIGFRALGLMASPQNDGVYDSLWASPRNDDPSGAGAEPVAQERGVQ